LSLPAGLEAFFMRPLTKVSSRFRGPFGTLLKKEFRLQQVSFLLAGVSVLIAAAACCLHQRHAEVARTIVWSDMLIYVFMLPLVAGAVSVGEERGWGMAEWHLTLPPSARMQWGAKLLATLSTSLLLGLLLPTILAVGAEALAGSLRPAIAAQSASVALGVVFAQVALTSVAVYAASFSRDTLRAILATFVLLAAGVGLVWSAAATAHQVIHRELYWLGYPLAIAELVRSLIPCALGFMLCLVHWFGWSNFRRLGATQPRLTAQLTVIFLGVWLITWLYFAMLIILTQS